MQSKGTISTILFLGSCFYICHKTCPRIGITNSSLALKVCNQPDEKEKVKWRRNKGVKTSTQGVSIGLPRAVLPLCGLAVWWSLGQHYTKHMAGKERKKHHLFHLPALNNQFRVVKFQLHSYLSLLTVCLHNAKFISQFLQKCV